jgi:biotin-independent malonate decarboxylase gamma subunit
VPIASPSTKIASLCAGAESIDSAGWLWRMRGRPLWLTRPCGPGTFGPHQAAALDAALLAHLSGGTSIDAQTVFLVEDSSGHEVSSDAEALCISQYLAQHAAVVALLRAAGVRLRGLITGVGHSAAFFANALQAQEIYAVAQARVVAMEPGAIARVTRVPEREITALIEDDPLLGHPVRHFAGWSGIAEIVPDVDSDRLLALAAREVVASAQAR